MSFQEGEFIDDSVVYSWCQNILKGSKSDWMKLVYIADNFHCPIAQGFMYFFVYHGYGRCEKDISKAIEYGNEALEWMKIQASEGNRYAQFLLGDAYRNGHLVSRDEIEAKRLYNLSADSECELAISYRAFCLMYGIGCERNYFHAAYWYKIAGKRTSFLSPSRCCNTVIYMAVEEALKGKQNGLDMLIVLSSADDTYEYNLHLAQGFLAYFYMMGVGIVSRDTSKAVEYLAKCEYWLRTCARNEMNDSCGYSQFILGCMYLKGCGVECDCIEAVNWLSKSANGAYRSCFAMAECYLGFCYVYGYGVCADYWKGYSYIRRSAEQGNVLGCYWCALCLLNCLENVKEVHHTSIHDVNEGLRLLKIAANSGYNEAQNKLGDLLFNGFEVESEEASKYSSIHCNKSPVAAVDSPERGSRTLPFSPIKCRVNSHRNSYIMGVDCLKINLVERNVREAVRWYEKAASTHLCVAQYNLSQCYHHNLICSSDNCKHAAKWFALYSQGIEKGLS